VRTIAFVRQIKGSVFVIGQQIRRRRKELKMSVDELAKRIGKDRSTIYRYENGDIGNMPLELLPHIVEALETTPQQLLSSIITSSEWLSNRAENWFDFTEGPLQAAIDSFMAVISSLFGTAA
jgi:transcriptional regulator with XRE-family HTH domain